MQVLSENFVNQSSYHLLLSLILNGIHNRNVPVKVNVPVVVPVKVNVPVVVPVKVNVPVPVEQIRVRLNTQIKKLLP